MQGFDSRLRKGGRERGRRPFLFPLPSRAGLAPARRGREQCLRRDLAIFPLVAESDFPAKSTKIDRCKLAYLPRAPGVDVAILLFFDSPVSSRESAASGEKRRPGWTAIPRVVGGCRPSSTPQSDDPGRKRAECGSEE
jgi:hypothetical protein